MSSLRKVLTGTAFLSLLAAPAFAQGLGLGRVALPEEIAAWDVAVLPDGQGLRPGRGTVDEGDEVFSAQCASCHGDFAEGRDSWPVLAGGNNTLTDQRPVKTVGSYWPHLSTVWDYVNRSMPFGAAQTLTTDEVYAITAYILYSNGIVDDDFELTHENFTDVVLPNTGGFYPDDRPVTEYPLFSVPPCMTQCSAPVVVSKRATDLKVTPTDPDGKPAGTMPVIAYSSMGEAGASPMAAEVVQVADAPAPTATEVTLAVVDPALIAEGEKQFRKCSACHKVGEGARNGTGPTLNGIVGHAAGAIDGFKYSQPLLTMAAEGLVWDEASLHAFLENPKGFMKGTKMSYAGLKKAEERAAVIAYLSTFAE